MKELHNIVVSEIEKCISKNEKRPIEYWLKYRGIGKKSIELIKARGVVAEKKLNELSHLEKSRQILLDNGFDTPDQILNGFLKEKIYVYSFRNYGAGSHQQICDFLIRWLACSRLFDRATK
jgi:hypothetical protein